MMRKTTLAATIALSVAIGGAGGMIIGGAGAQPAPPPAALDDAAPPPPPGHGWMQRGMHHGPGGPGRERAMHLMRTFGLFYHPEDKQLTTADVQKIAEAFLLWNGNHAWKVTNLAEGADNTVAFALATQEGSVVARFTMDRKTGRVERTG